MNYFMYVPKLFREIYFKLFPKIYYMKPTYGDVGEPVSFPEFTKFCRLNRKITGILYLDPKCTIIHYTMQAYLRKE